MNNDILAAHKVCSNHRDEILNSTTCGCFYCLMIFTPDKILEWTDEYNSIGTTALCPYCSIDSVIGDKSGFSITSDFLAKMKKHWF